MPIKLPEMVQLYLLAMTVKERNVDRTGKRFIARPIDQASARSAAVPGNGKIAYCAAVGTGGRGNGIRRGEGSLPRPRIHEASRISKDRRPFRMGDLAFCQE